MARHYPRKVNPASKPTAKNPVGFRALSDAAEEFAARLVARGKLALTADSMTFRVVKHELHNVDRARRREGFTHAELAEAFTGI